MLTSPNVFMAHPTKLHIVAGGKQQKPKAKAKRVGLTMILRWHEEKITFYIPREYFWRTNLINIRRRRRRRIRLFRSSKRINLVASHETSKAKTWVEIKSFSVIASVYLRSWRFTRVERAYQRCGKLLSFQHKNPARSETWEYFWKSFEMRDLNGEFDAEKAFYDVIMRGRGRTYRVEGSQSGAKFNSSEKRENFALSSSHCRRVAVVAGRRESLLRFVKMEKQGKRWNGWGVVS